MPLGNSWGKIQLHSLDNNTVPPHLPSHLHRRDFDHNTLTPNLSASFPSTSGNNLLPKQPLNRPASYLLALNLTIPLQHLDELAFRKGFDGDLATAASTHVGLEMLRELGGGEDVCGDAHDVWVVVGWRTVRRNAFVALVSLGSRGNVIFGFLLW